jgi:hypothetical protein
MNTRNLVLLVAAAVAIVAAASLKSQRTPVEVRPAASGVYDCVQLSVSAASERNHEAARLCESEINMVFAREFPEIERRANIAAEKVAAYGSCCTIIYRLAKERLGWSSSTSDYVEGELSRRLQPALDACGDELKMAIDRYELALRESTVTLATELAQANPANAGNPIAVNVDVRTNGDLNAMLRGLGVSGGVLAITGAFDVAAVMNTSIVRGLITRIAQIAASVFAKPAATAAGSAAVAAADGPFPVGDAFAVLGAIWTGYEISSARHAFEQDINSSLANALPEMKRSVHHQVMERIHSLRSDYQRAQDEIRNQMAANFTR